jgi:hypothetical protein
MVGGGVTGMLATEPAALAEVLGSFAGSKRPIEGVDIRSELA